MPEDDKDLVGQTAWVTGWGRLYEGNNTLLSSLQPGILLITDGPLPAVLQEVDLPIINNTQCEAMYEKAGFREHIPHIFICAGYREGGKDSCEVMRVLLFTVGRREKIFIKLSRIIRKL